MICLRVTPLSELFRASPCYEFFVIGRSSSFLIISPFPLVVSHTLVQIKLDSNYAHTSSSSNPLLLPAKT
ncbi:hypothetical protein RIF29_10858 [Crotalaria pallida]|uniref:Uncharacterized protein n=1 Tax=Crotalaria pallida TaxID=3830 RepID=A0AAN9IK83_CROPI